MHMADQIALVAVPIVAALVFDAPAEVIGVLVACQSVAFLAGSIPLGLLVDTYRLNRLAIAAALVALCGFSIASIAVALKILPLFGAAIVFSGFGIVLFTLTVLSIVSQSVAPQSLSTANASIELPRAIASFAAPLGIGFLATVVSGAWLFPAAAGGALLGLAFVLRLPSVERPSIAHAESPIRRIAEGGRFVVRHGLLRAILLCSIFWNFAFSALLVTMVPVIRDIYRMEANVLGIAMACFGLGAIIGSWISRQFGGRIAPNVILLFGPGISVIASTILYLAPAADALPFVCVAFFLIGFGPSMWLIAQNSVRQIVSPKPMLGRVSAVIQTAIYGVRPLAAVAAGLLVGAVSPQAGLAVVSGAFALSFLAAASSGLRHVRRYSDLTQAEGA
jgi:predicted MFS family arabinose efflux permease